MSLDGKLLARARARLAAGKAANEAETERRRSEVYLRVPEVMEIDSRLRVTMAKAIAAAFSSESDPVAAVESARDENLDLQERRRAALQAAGFPRDYLDERYNCPICHDTGYVDAKPCRCLMALYADEQRLELSALLKLGSETFDSFDLEKYSDAPMNGGISPRQHMEMVYETCVEYARKFSASSPNLFFSGGTGLGKTFLSTCIAKVVSEKGFSVVYDTAYSLFSRYEGEKFGRTDDMDSVRSDIRRYETCDLLIIDDLGTEMTTAFVTSALYTLVNTRLVTGKKTVISSNLTPEALWSRYSPAVASRLSGEYTVLRFYGEDIRLSGDGA